MVVEFVKVFLPDRSTHQLLLPPAFVRKHRELIHKNLTLRDKTGTLWNVDVERDGTNMYITNGWHEFVTDNSLEFGDFILFTCSTKSVYNVQVLKGKDSVDVDDPAFVKKDDSRSPSACNRLPIKAVPISTIKASVDLPRSRSRKLDGMSSEKRKRNDMPHVKSIARPDAPHCIVTMKEYHRYTMRFPPESLRENGIQFLETVYLRDHNDKLWPIRIYFYGQASVLSSGWSDFRNHMKLNCEDKCLFEFVLERGNICKEMKIQVFYANPRKAKVPGSLDDLPRSQSRRLDGMYGEKHKSMHNASALVGPKAPHFIVTIRKYHRYTLILPQKPLKQNRIKIADTVYLRDHKNKLWPVKVYFSLDGQATVLSTGWSRFRRQMNLDCQDEKEKECEDQCLFEFVLERGNICKELKVKIFYGSP